jgi:hypothetical protein
MKKASIRDLRHGFNKIERLLRQGEEIQITPRPAGDCPPHTRTRGSHRGDPGFPGADAHDLRRQDPTG